MSRGRMSDGNAAGVLRTLYQSAGNGLLWLAVAILLIIILAAFSFRFDEITGEQVGVKLNKLNGDMEIIDRPGTCVYFGITEKLFILDKTLQTLEMTERPGRGDRQGKDDLKVKTVDGSDVYVDLKVQYRIDISKADFVLLTSGLNDGYKHKWARDYTRSIARNYLGELTTEEFYDSTKRNAKVLAAKIECAKRLAPYGIKIDSLVIPTKPHFYAEYEKMIKDKKLADQAVLEERSKELAAKQKQQTLIVQETNIKKVAIEQFEGQMRQKVIKAEAEGERARQEADAYYDKVTIGAKAALYQNQKAAEGILAEKSAEAKGIEALKKALEGEGGRNMVKLEYARKLKDVKINALPYTVNGTVEKFEHNTAPAASTLSK